ncbi:surface lipoprotein assembly modifier [Avibacterium avium]|uniref:surface lipoprotein assembly modifier n=1 Tax=Avibacterium avium TaxID=751 RepID=UPI003BF7832A
MKYFSLGFTLLAGLLGSTFSLSLWAANAPLNKPLPEAAPTEVAKPQAQAQQIQDPRKKSTALSFTKAELMQNFSLTRQLLFMALQQSDVRLLEALLPIYQGFKQADPLTVQFVQGKLAVQAQDYTQGIQYFRAILAKNERFNPVRLELAMALFQDYQIKEAEQHFVHLQQEKNPPQINDLIEAYLNAIAQRREWDFSANAYYTYTKNVNNVADNVNVEDTGYIKNDSLLPQSAHGIAYSLSLNKDWNLAGNHYLALESFAQGKFYWDNHDYDDLYTRIYAGYKYKQAHRTLALLPFYGRRWFSNESYNWEQGVRAEFSQWLSQKWQLSLAGEYYRQRYFDGTSQNGNSKMLSATLLWARNAKQYFYLGSDFTREKTQVKQYSSDLKSVRFGWGQAWGWHIQTRLNLSFAIRDYKDKAVLGNILDLGKVRKDKIYQSHLTLWKQDWSKWGFTPKIRFSYKKQRSNLPTMYSYTDKGLYFLLDKTF